MNETLPLELLLVRHGECQYNRDGTGGADSPLTEGGVLQAQRLAGWLAAQYRFAALYSSPLLRARQTAEIIAATLKLSITSLEGLREAEFDLAAALPCFDGASGALDLTPPAVQDLPARYLEFKRQVVETFRGIVCSHGGGTLLVVTHGGVMGTLLRSIFGGHQVSVYVDNTCALLLRWQNARWYLVFSNRREHLV